MNELKILPSPKPLKAIVQGVVPSLDTPITWLYEYCAHPDNFLYIYLEEAQDPEAPFQK